MGLKTYKRNCFPHDVVDEAIYINVYCLTDWSVIAMEANIARHTTKQLTVNQMNDGDRKCPGGKGSYVGPSGLGWVPVEWV